MLALIVVMLIDTSVVKIYEVINKSFAPFYTKILLFSSNALLCLVLQYVVLRQVWTWLHQLNDQLHAKGFYRISLFALCILGALLT
ncbi:MAG TPA: hypothetical protein VFH04_03620, partial [Nitrososphaeraceae archaeon]|nr:hypothetical protein [Nitrososphaeraceae archaeon]